MMENTEVEHIHLNGTAPPRPGSAVRTLPAPAADDDVRAWLDAAVGVIDAAPLQARVKENLIIVMKLYADTYRKHAGADGDFGLGITEVVRRTRIPRATCQRLITTLQELGLVRQTEAGNYKEKIAARWALVARTKENSQGENPEKGSKPSGSGLDLNELPRNELPEMSPTSAHSEVGSAFLLRKGSTHFENEHGNEHVSGPVNGPVNRNTGPVTGPVSHDILNPDPDDSPIVRELLRRSAEYKHPNVVDREDPETERLRPLPDLYCAKCDRGAARFKNRRFDLYVLPVSHNGKPVLCKCGQQKLFVP